MSLDCCPQCGYVHLTIREKQVASMLGSGMRPFQICERLCLSPKTVHTYAERARKKFNLKSNLQLALYAARNGLQP